MVSPPLFVVLNMTSIRCYELILLSFPRVTIYRTRLVVVLSLLERIVGQRVLIYRGIQHAVTTTTTNQGQQGI